MIRIGTLQFTHDFNTVIYLENNSLHRFTAEEKAKRPQLSHLPFGFGPRSCIGMRFALLEAKIALMELLKRYTFVRAPDTEVTNLSLSKLPHVYI